MNTLFLIDLLYTLRCDWGQGMTYRSNITSTVDPVTGEVINASQDFPIGQGIMLPAEVARSFASILRLGNYQYGSEHDSGASVILIEKSQLPLGLIPTLADHILCQNRQYEPKTLVDLIEAWEFVVVELADQ